MSTILRTDSTPVGATLDGTTAIPSTDVKTLNAQTSSTSLCTYLPALQNLVQTISRSFSSTLSFFTQPTRRVSAATIAYFHGWYVYVLQHRQRRLQQEVETEQRRSRVLMGVCAALLRQKAGGSRREGLLRERVDLLEEKVQIVEGQREDLWLEVQETNDRVEDVARQRDEVVDQREVELDEVKKLRVELQVVKNKGYLKDAEISVLRAWVRLIPLPWTTAATGVGDDGVVEDDSAVDDMD